MDYLLQDPDHTYKSYQKFLKRGEYKKAYRCLERLLKEFPDDAQLLGAIVNLAVAFMGDYQLARPWVLQRIREYPSWLDYVLLSRIEADRKEFGKAEESLARAMALRKVQRGSTPRTGSPNLIFAETRDFIKLKQWEAMSGREDRPAVSLPRRPPPSPRKETASPPQPPTKQPAPHPAVSESPEGTPPGRTGEVGKPSPESVEGREPVRRIPIRFAPFNDAAPDVFRHPSPLEECLLRIEYARLGIQGGFDELLCLNAVRGIEKYWYQIETVKKALKQFHGRVLLADEVGLGKTVEAGMLIKEYRLRGMARSILILVPAPLVSQWKEEMLLKFGLDFVTTEDSLFAEDPDRFWKESLIIASIHTAKGKKNFSQVTGRQYDVVLVDEAHHLKNRKTLAWKLVNEIRKRFIFLLTATPVQNNLIELYNLITLLKPGQFKTESAFRKEYLQRGGDRRVPANKEKLRGLLREVMIRNTRSVIDLKLPNRFASTLRITPTGAEKAVYDGVDDLIRRRLPGDGSGRFRSKLLLREAGSSPDALMGSLLRMREKGEGLDLDPLIEAIRGMGSFSKGTALMELLRKNPDGKRVIFTQYVKSMEYVERLLRENGLPFAAFRGDMPSREKDAAVERFRGEIPILVASESGGEGRNLQFCDTIINFDLPWNPMRIEQRIGRLHRIGQTRDVFVFNLSTEGTLEDYILRILETKINMFEMVIGEIEPILGSLEERHGEDREFEDIVMDLWLHHPAGEAREKGFESLGKELIEAKAAYLRTRELDQELLGEEYEA
ncbi:MAG: DEAD/DEAH box helicase family protein [Nitrospirae bacterium]|nr:DEAD/DEAH box helicase family protein [Nitrospirota bacterium]